MKKIFGVILVLAAFVFCIWLFLYHPAKTTHENSMPIEPTQIANPIQAPIVSNAPPQPTEPTQTENNVFVRPASIDENQWNRLMMIRQLALEQNQPIEFYARVLDQNEQPVEGAKLKLLLARTDEKMFETTNFFHHQIGDEVLNIRFEVISDANGQFQVTGTNGSFLEVWGLTKEGYLSSYPDGNSGGVYYKPHGARTPMGDILMTNAWDPRKGYILHLQKIEGTNTVNPGK